jgi:23S rRNA (cytosine1962-C5)-methyltransferase
MSYEILVSKPEKDYELLDSGGGEKLERYGNVTVSRPDPQALWNKSAPEHIWGAADAKFTTTTKTEEKKSWKIKSGIPEKWNIEFGNLKFVIKLSAFKHTGLFPEQKANWKWVEEAVSKKSKENKISVLNLFGYTGGATLAASKAGADVVHVDGSKAAITWAKENAALSGLAEKNIRWILDDALAFVKREAKRGNKYHGIIMDPPAFGRGPIGEVWKIEDGFLELLKACKEILAPEPLFVLINGYASGYSAIGYQNSLEFLMKDFSGTIQVGEVAIQESRSERLLPSGIFARWQAK